MTEDDIQFIPAVESDFEDFMTLRKAVMRPHVDRLGLPWNEEWQEAYHRELFATEGLHSVTYKGVRIGYVGMYYDVELDKVVLSRGCMAPEYQNNGIGTLAMQKIFKEPICQGRTLFLDVLLQNPAARLYERMGFVKIKEDETMAYYERPLHETQNYSIAKSALE
jgi:ribosomal protein S18 acetylase RimI-like enzyme